MEDILPLARIWCHQLLLVEGIQGTVAVEVNVVSIGRKLVAREQRGIVGVIDPANTKFCDVKPARHSSGPLAGSPPS